MEMRTVMGRASDAAVAVVRGIGPGEWELPTPCPELTVGALLDHLHHWTAVVGPAAGRKLTAAERTAPERAGEPAPEDAFTALPDGAEAFAAGAARTAAVWGEPAAWEGEASLTGEGSMPAPFVGGILLDEWLLHGWDLAVATGQTLRVDEEAAAALYEDVAGRAEMARRFGAFGPEVPVPADAPLFDRALGLSGRDPHWKPSS